MFFEQISYVTRYRTTLSFGLRLDALIEWDGHSHSDEFAGGVFDFHNLPLVYQAPNHTPMPCTQATGKNNAPATRKPHEPSARQTIMCVNQLPTRIARQAMPSGSLMLRTAYRHLTPALAVRLALQQAVRLAVVL